MKSVYLIIFPTIGLLLLLLPLGCDYDDEAALVLNVALAEVRADIQVADFHIVTERKDSHAQN